MIEKYELAYPVNTVQWDGHIIRQLPDRDIDAQLDDLQEAGIAKVMLAGYQLEEPADFGMLAAAEKLGEKLHSRGMAASQHHGLACTYAEPHQSQSEVRKKLKLVVEITACLGAESLVLHAGRIEGKHGSAEHIITRYKQQINDHGLAAVMAASAENFSYAGDIAGQCGVQIALENLDRFEPLSDMELLPQLITQIDNPAVGYCLDAGHAHCAGISPATWIEVMGDKLFTTHFHDNRGCRGDCIKKEGFISPQGIDEHLPPGFGTIAWIDVIAALRKIGYNRTVTFESGPWPGENKIEGYRNAISFWRTVEKMTSMAKENHG